MEILRKCQSEICVDGCDMEWYECARQVLQMNSMNPFMFFDPMRDLIERGRGKFHNVLIVGPTNCGKTFLLKPLEIIFCVFTNPANNMYTWIDADQAQVIVLQEFRWNSELIFWKDLLHLLEGENVKLLSPKIQFVTDVYINTGITIFATRKAKIEFAGKHNTRDDRETEMINVRWNIFEFTYRIPQPDQKIITPSPRWLTELVLLGS